MRDRTIARNYAETLFALGERHGALEAYGDGIGGVARLLDESPEFRLFLETPRVDASAKKEVVRKAFGDALPRPLLNFLLLTIDKRRQGLLGAIAREYGDLMDGHEGRAHVEVTVARPLDDATVDTLAERLSRVLGVRAIPRVQVKPGILGGVVIRAGDTIYDGSLRRRLETMRRQLMAAELPELAGANASGGGTTPATD